MFDLQEFKDRVAYVFFYNFDLTEVFDITLNDDGTLSATVPDQDNPTPNPTPIPDPHGINPQQDPSPLSYPPISLIRQKTALLLNGDQYPPKKFTIKKFLRIKGKDRCNISMEKVITKIRKTVFGKNYCLYRHLIDGVKKESSFEYHSPLNYLHLLNPDYYYNLPDSKTKSTRNLLLFSDDGENSNIPGGDPNGSTEVILGTNRIAVDLWNSNELDLGYAMEQYNLKPNNYQPSKLPTCLFTIFPTNTEYSNLKMIANDTLTIEFYNHPIRYADHSIPMASTTIVFPSNQRPMNINQLKNLFNETFSNSFIYLNGTMVRLSRILEYDWTFYPYKYQYLKKESAYVKSIMVKTTNRSSYSIRFKGKWQLLQLFGKPMAAMPEQELRSTDNLDHNLVYMYPSYATDNPNGSITTYNGMAELIIRPLTTYYGPIDGFQADSIQNFSVIKDTTERWIYHNLDDQDSHPLHFHLTSGFVDPFDIANSKLQSYSSLLYSRDVYAIPSQQNIAFYLRFPNYSSGMASLNPPIPYTGYMYHCHYMTHHDMNMMGAYFVFKDQEEYEQCLG